MSTFHGGGAERETINIANGLAAIGEEVHFLYGRDDGPLFDLLNRDLVKINLDRKRTYQAFLALRQYLKEENPDVLITSLLTANIINAICTRLSGVNTLSVLCEHSTPSGYYKEGIGWRVKILKPLARFAFRLSDAVVSVSGEARNDVLDFYGLPPEKVKLLYNPVVSDKLYQLAEEPVNHPWLTGNWKVIVAMGRVVEAKDYPTLIRAFAEVRRTRKATKLIVLGVLVDDFQYKQCMEIMEEHNLRDHVEFMGFKKNPFSYLKRSDLYVLSSKREALPSGIIQALALGKKVVSTDCTSGPSEVLKDGRYGALVPVGDHTALAGALIENLRTNRIDYKPQEAVAPFTYEQSIQEYHCFVQELLHKQSTKFSRALNTDAQQ